MARTRRRSRSKLKNRAITATAISGRDVRNIARTEPTFQVLPTISNNSRSRTYAISLPSKLLQDDRFYHPDNNLPPRTISGNFSRVRVPAGAVGGNRLRHNIKRTYPSSRVVVKVPARTVECIRRKRRREVINALGIAGSKVAKPRYKSNSYIKCR